MSENPEAESAGGKGANEDAPHSSNKTCYNCGQDGHIARNCENPRVEGEGRSHITKERFKGRRCFNCGKIGHISADCTKPAGNKSCYNCGKEGHIARDCPEERNQD